MKTCKRCGQNKERSEFGADMRYKDNRLPWCRGCYRAYGAEWAKRNRERLNEKAAAWRATNPDKARAVALRSSRKLKDERATYARQWTRANRDKRRASSAKRKALKLRAIPMWADIQAIRDFYESAPLGYQVDHIVPLNSPLVCGLHWVGNLQYLPAADNQSKRNFRWPDMPRIENAQRQSSLLDAYDANTQSYEQVKLL